jgi:hypothetical protein
MSPRKPSKPGKQPAKIHDLPVRNLTAVKGGSTMLSSAVSTTVKTIGSALQTAARG